MDNLTEKKLFNEVCTIKIENQYLVGKITEIDADKSFIEILSNYSTFEQNEQIEIRIENFEQEDVILITCLIESMNKTDNNLTLAVKSISRLIEKNKRQYKRLKVELLSKDAFNVLLQPFPPQDLTNWVEGELIDISEGGVQLKDNNFLSTGQLIEMKIGSPFFEKDQYIVSRVVNRSKINNDFIFSIQFLNLSDRNREIIQKFIDNAYIR